MKVKIKTWSEMEEEFGLFVGSIDCKCSFTKIMEGQIPEDRIIEISDDYAWEDIDDPDLPWNISEEMIKEKL